MVPVLVLCSVASSILLTAHEYVKHIAARAVDKIKLFREFADRKAVEGNVLAVFGTSDVVPFPKVAHGSSSYIKGSAFL